MRIAILGFGRQGRSAWEYYRQAGHQLTVCDANTATEVPANTTKQLGPDYLKDLDRFDLIVRGSPGIHPHNITTANPDTPHILDKVTTSTNEFFRVCPSANIIGVTGTKGKGTTSSLIGLILQAAGYRVHVGGNIGIPPLDLLKHHIQPTDWVVLELANFQLIDLKFSPHIGVCVMVVPEHLNWHTDMEEYVAAKQTMFRFQTVHDWAVYNRGNAYSTEIAGVSAGQKISYEVPGPGAEPHNRHGTYLLGETIYMEGTPICQAHEVGLLGRHNLENVCAAVAATWQLVHHDVAVLRRVISQFGGLPHRLELVRTVNGVKFYNDSFAATPEAAMAAVDAVTGPKVMIMGGFDRDLPLDGLVHTLVLHTLELPKVLLIGASASRLAAALTAASFTNFQVLTDVTMSQIVQQAAQAAHTGSSVVLSPGFPSFDMFKDFEDRGLQFKQAVKAL